MPTYVYKCASCGHTFEARQRMTDSALTDCPACEKSALRRVINSVGVVFKGSGFYVTDNRNGPNGAAASNGSTPSAKDSDSKSETGGDAKSSSESTGTTEKKTEAE